MKKKNNNKKRKYILLFIALILYTIIVVAIDRNRYVGLIQKAQHTYDAMVEGTEISKLQKQIEKLQNENEEFATQVSSSMTSGDNILYGELVWTNGNIEEGTMPILTGSDFSKTHSSTSAGSPSNYIVKSTREGYVANNTTVATLTATTSPEIATTGDTGTQTINIKPGYYNKIKVNQTAAYNKGYNLGLQDGETDHTETYNATTRSSSIDLGLHHAKRYINTSSVPNSNSTTYTFPANSTGATYDMGETNNVRYVNAANVYAKGKADGFVTGLKKIGTGAGTYNLSSYTGYKSFTVGKNIICTSYSYANAYGGHNTSGDRCNMTASLSISYNASTGILTVSNGFAEGSDDNLSGDVYCYCDGVYITAQ